MSDFKVGDKVRATEAFAQRTREWHEARGIEPEGATVRVLAGETLEVVRVDPADVSLPFPVGAQFVEGEKYTDWFEDHMAFETDELEHVEG